MYRDNFSYTFKTKESSSVDSSHSVVHSFISVDTVIAESSSLTLLVLTVYTLCMH